MYIQGTYVYMVLIKYVMGMWGTGWVMTLLQCNFKVVPSALLWSIYLVVVQRTQLMEFNIFLINMIFGAEKGVGSSRQNKQRRSQQQLMAVFKQFP